MKNTKPPGGRRFCRKPSVVYLRRFAAFRFAGFRFAAFFATFFAGFRFATFFVAFFAVLRFFVAIVFLRVTKLFYFLDRRRSHIIDTTCKHEPVCIITHNTHVQVFFLLQVWINIFYKKIIFIFIF